MPQTGHAELTHIRTVIGGSVVKAPSIKKGGVLLAAGKQFASVVVGLDMTTGFIGPAGCDYEFKISESLAPRIRVPGSICVLNA